MTAKFGKASVGCFIGFWSAVLFVTTGDGPLLPFALALHGLFILGGLVFAIFRLATHERPKTYSIIGLLLNFALFCIICFNIISNL